MMKYLLLLILSVSVSWSYDDTKLKESEASLTLLAQVKMAGICGTYKQMALFQESTKMAGGDEFLQRYINTEVARLNITHDTLLKMCENATQTYDTTLKAVEEVNNEERRKLFEEADKVTGYKQ